MILISIDSLRGDRLGCYGYPRPVSPALDRLASEGILFADVLSQSSWTLPAHVSLMTSLYAHRHGVISERARMRPGQPTLARVLRANGYTTAGVVSGPYVRSAFGFAEGFDRFDESPSLVESRAHHHQGAHAPRTHRAVLDILETAPREPLFLFVHYWDVHYDYAPPPPFAEIFGYEDGVARSFAHFAQDKTIDASLNAAERSQLAALYDGEIRYTDGMIEELLLALDAAGFLDRSIVIVTADHGDEFFEHGGKGHQKTLYDEVVKIPLILWASDARWGHSVVSEPVELIDVLPTVLAAAGIPADTLHVDGRSLLGAIAAPRAEAGSERSRPRYTDTEISAKRKGGRSGDRLRLGAILRENRKLIVTQGAVQDREMYDLSADPREQIDLAATDSAMADSLGKSIVARVVAPPRGSGGRMLAALRDTAIVDPALEEELRALGYVE